MKSVQLSDLGPLAQDVRNGETIELVDAGKVVAQVVPSQAMTIEEHIDELAAQGLVTKGTGKLPDWFFTERPPKFESGSVLEQLLADRRKNDW